MDDDLEIQTGDAVVDRVRTVLYLLKVIPLQHATEMVSAWLRQDVDLAVALVLELARMVDPEQPIRDAHAAYSRGDRSPAVVELERRYQRYHKQRNRSYQQQRQARGVA